MAIFVQTTKKMKDELQARWQTLNNLLDGKPLAKDQHGFYRVKNPEDLRVIDHMAIRLAVNDFKGILAEVVKLK
ncbi:MAG: hypothetical protein M0R68_15320 [Bacteroidetes bacterium]|nr:hypothetical protein [Bacteroidota bacterium]